MVVSEASSIRNIQSTDLVHDGYRGCEAHQRSSRDVDVLHIAEHSSANRKVQLLVGISEHVVTHMKQGNPQTAP